MADKTPAEQPGKTDSHEERRKRVTQQFLERRSFDEMADPDVLEMLLCYGIPGKDTAGLASSLLDRFGSFDRVFSATHAELLSVKGMSENAATLIEMVLHVYKRYAVRDVGDKLSISATGDLVDFFRAQYIGDTRERVMMMCFDANDKFISSQTVCMGSLNFVNLELRRFVEIAIEQRASKAIISHNHPYNVAKASNRDIDATVQITSLLSKIGVKLVEHIIIADDSYFSMRESELLSLCLYYEK